MATHREIEIKLRVEDLAAIVAKIRALGGSTRGRVREYNVLFDTPDAAIRTLGCLLRLRTEVPAGSRHIPAGPRGAWVTWKAPAPRRRKVAKSPFKEKLESELAVTDPASFRRRLLRLGFRSDFCYEKFRTTFTLRGVRLDMDLDETPVGTILELEGDPGAIRRIARRLGFAPRDYLRATYWELNAAECRRRGVQPGNMLFGG